MFHFFGQEGTGHLRCRVLSPTRPVSMVYTLGLGLATVKNKLRNSKITERLMNDREKNRKHLQISYSSPV